MAAIARTEAIMDTTLTMQRDALLLPLLAAQKVAPTHTPKDILKFVRMVSSSDTEVQLRATDGEISLTLSLPNLPNAGVDVLLPVGRLVAVLRELPASELTLVVDEQAVTVKYGNSEFQLLAGGDPVELPTPDLDGLVPDHWQVPASALRHILRRTAFACDTQTTRYALGGVLLSVASPSGFVLTAVATDSRRLAVMSCDCTRDGEPTMPAAGVLPLKCVKLLESTLPDTDELVAVYITENSFVFRWAGVTVHGRQVEGRFPKWESILPTDAPVKLELVAGPLARVVRQSRICTSEETRGVDFQFGTESLELASKAADVGTSAVSLPIVGPATPIVMTMDPKFIEDVLRVVDAGELCTFGLTDSDSAALVSFADGFRYLVMPMGGA